MFVIIKYKEKYIMEFYITEKKFKNFSKNLKKLINELNIDFTLGATQNLLARTFGYKDYNTIVPDLKKYNLIPEALKNTNTALNELKTLVNNHDNDKGFSDIESFNKLNQISFTLFQAYKFAIKHMNNTAVLIFDENLYLDSQATIYLEVINTIAQCYYLISVQDGKQLNFDFLENIKLKNIPQKQQKTYLKPLSKIILNAISSINLSNIDEEPTENYIEQFETIFSEIIVFGLTYLGKEKINQILKIVFKGLQENDLKLKYIMEM